MRQLHLAAIALTAPPEPYPMAECKCSGYQKLAIWSCSGTAFLAPDATPREPPRTTTTSAPEPPYWRVRWDPNSWTELACGGNCALRAARMVVCRGAGKRGTVPASWCVRGRRMVLCMRLCCTSARGSAAEKEVFQSGDGGMTVRTCVTAHPRERWERGELCALELFVLKVEM